MSTLKLKSKHRPFCFSVKGHVKMFRLDLINTFITAVFLLIVAILTIQEKDRRHLFYVGGTLCLTAAILCLVDATLVTKTMRNNIKRALGMKKEPDHSLAQAEPPNPPSKNL
uniref:Chemokine like factor n=1 Tax=Rousettus aegyptiacus TaxID=9407 RepID=A0A7J8CEZ1_ROUAE|nr:chemokine like factor [Rousettus aegyptiacus]